MAFLAELDAYVHVPASDSDDDDDADVEMADAPAPAADAAEEEEEPVHRGPSLADPAGFALATRVTLEAPSFPWNEAATAGETSAGVASFAAAAGADALSVAGRWRRARLRWEYGASAFAASVAAGDGEWCDAVISAYEGWRAERASKVYARFNGLSIVWARDEDAEQVVLAYSPDATASAAVAEAIDDCEVPREAVSVPNPAVSDRRFAPQARATVVAGRGPTACRAVLNCALMLRDADAKAPPRETGLARPFAVLSDGAFDNAQLKTLDQTFNRTVKRPNSTDTVRIVLEGWVHPGAKADLRESAAAAACTATVIDVHAATAVFDAPAVAKALQDLRDGG